MKHYAKRMKRAALLRARIKKALPFAHQKTRRRALYRKIHEQLYGHRRITAPKLEG